MAHDDLGISRMSLDHHVGVIMTDATGKTDVLSVIERSRKPISDSAPLRIIEPYGWKFQGQLRGAAQSGIVRIMGIGSSAGDRGRGTKLVKLP